jgi:hypothetical protein
MRPKKKAKKVKKAKKTLLVKKVKDQHEVDVLWGEVLTTEALTTFGIT